MQLIRITINDGACAVCTDISYCDIQATVLRMIHPVPIFVSTDLLHLNLLLVIAQCLLCMNVVFAATDVHKCCAVVADCVVMINACVSVLLWIMFMYLIMFVQLNLWPDLRSLCASAIVPLIKSMKFYLLMCVIMSIEFSILERWFCRKTWCNVLCYIRVCPLSMINGEEVIVQVSLLWYCITSKS